MRTRLTVSVLLLIIFQLAISTTGKGQSITTDKVTLALHDESLETAIKKIEQQTSFRFYYRTSDISELNHLNLTQGTRTIEQTLTLLLQNSDLYFRQIDYNILLERKAQHTPGEIQGRVLDSLNAKPLANASVFLSNATVGSTTAEDGTFTLSNIKPGKYDLVVSVIGYEPYQMAINADATDKLLPDIRLTAKTVVLKEVTINATADPDRERYYELFKDEFLGVSPFAQDCKILNPEVLDLSYDKETGTLTASSSDFLRIENKSLGYDIKYLLTDFIKITGEKNDMKVQYSGSVFFQEMQGTSAQEKRWQKKRLELYEGSAMHFLRSGLNNSIEEEGFRVLKVATTKNPQRPCDTLIEGKINFFERRKNEARRYRDSLTYWELKRSLPKTFETLEPKTLSQADIVQLTNQKGLYALLSNNGALYVAYSKKHHFNNTDKLNYLGEPFDKQGTVLNFDTPYILFDKNGGILNPDCVSFVGAWGKGRVAELLPVDYEPGESGSEVADKAIKSN